MKPNQQPKWKKKLRRKIKAMGFTKDPTISNADWKELQVYEAGFNRAKEIILYILKET